MAALVAVLIFIAVNWNRQELKTIRDNFIAITVFPLAMLLAAALVGGWSWRAKLFLIELELAVAVIGILWLAARRIAITAEIVAVAAAASPTLTVQQAALGYIRFVASILAAEIFAGLVTLWAPVHGDLALSFLGLFLGIGWLVYWLWTGEEVVWWQRIVKFAIGFSLAAIVSGVLVPYLMPQTTAEFGRHGGMADDASLSIFRGVMALFRGTAAPWQAFYAVAVVLILALGVRKLVVSAVARAVAGGVIAFTLVALVAWFVWGAGAAAIGAVPSAAGEIERREIRLEPPGTWVPVGALEPWRYKVDQQLVRGQLVIRFSDGSQDTLDPGVDKKFGGSRYPAAFKGEGTALLWLCPPPSRACE